MTHLSNIKHIFFDLDDTLWDFELNSAAVLQQLFTEFKLAQKLNADFHTFHVGYKKINAELWRLYYQKQLVKEELRNQRFHQTLLAFGYANYEESLAISELYLQRSPYGTILKPNCIEVLDYLKPKYQLHIITNGFKEVQHIKLQSCGLSSYFENVIISEEHGLIKPDVAIFRLAERLSGASDKECVMIGDNLESDITGGKNAGWETIHFNDSNHHTTTNFRSIKNLEELKELF
jgi:putative hydrolase of the HAD superfamily